MNREPDAGGPGFLTPETLAELEVLVRRRLGGRLRDFRLSIREAGLVLSGYTRSYHAKQLAQRALMDMTRASITANEIKVHDSPGDANADACVAVEASGHPANDESISDRAAVEFVVRAGRLQAATREVFHRQGSKQTASPEASCPRQPDRPQAYPGDNTMKALWNYRPDLRACELEDRLLPAIPDLGATVLTTGGYDLLLSPFPVTAADPFGQLGGPGFLTPSAMSGSAGVAGLLPGNSPGVPGLVTTAPTGSNGGAAGTIFVGSGADTGSAPIIPPVTRNTIANDNLNAAPLIGLLSGDQSPVLPPGQVYQGGLPVTNADGYSVDVPGQRAAPEPALGPVDPLPLRIQIRPHPLASGISGNLIRPRADRAP